MLLIQKLLMKKILKMSKDIYIEIKMRVKRKNSNIPIGIRTVLADNVNDAVQGLVDLIQGKIDKESDKKTLDLRKNKEDDAI